MAMYYRSPNSITVFHAEPINKLTEDLNNLNGSKYLTENDITKAYHQVQLSDRTKPLTAFPSHKEPIKLCCLPFGLVTACATYIRLMRIVLAGLHGVSFYFDNIFTNGVTWAEHTSA